MSKYIYTAEQFDQTRTEISANCSGILFINTGSTTAYINRMPLLAGASLSLDDQNRDIDTTKYQLNFGGFSGTITVWRKTFK